MHAWQLAAGRGLASPSALPNQLLSNQTAHKRAQGLAPELGHVLEQLALLGFQSNADSHHPRVAERRPAARDFVPVFTRQFRLPASPPVGLAGCRSLRCRQRRNEFLVDFVGDPGCPQMKLAKLARLAMPECQAMRVADIRQRLLERSKDFSPGLCIHRR